MIATDAPVLLPAGAAPRPALLRLAVIMLAGVLGVLASVAVFKLALSWEYRAAENEFQSKAKDQLQVIANEIQAASTLLYTYRSYFNASDHAISRAEFDRFSMALHDRVVGLRDTGWAPRVTRDQREAFEREVRATGEASFQILERDASGKMARAGDRPEYLPILYLDSGAVTRPVLGFDLLSEPTRKLAIARAQASREPAATPPVSLITVKRPRGGVMGFIAVGIDAPERRSNPARGVALGVVEIDAMMDDIVTVRARSAGIDVTLLDPAAAPDQRLIYWHSAATKAVAAPPTEQDLLAGTHLQGTVSMFDQRWTAVFTPTEKLDRVAWNWHALMPLVVGLAMTAMVVAYLIVSLRRTEQLERLTAELHRKTEDLHRTATQVAHMARHDTLTGLPNRALFGERMDEAIERLRRGVPFAVLCMDLDRFKAVNDSLGHGGGDRLLCEVAQRLDRCVRQVDTVARLGGDEFAIILAEASSADMVERVALRLVEAIGAACEIDGRFASVGLSVGIALAPGDGSAADVLLTRADRALYAAKAAGRGRHCFFEATPNDAVVA